MFNDLARFCPNVCSVLHAYTYVCLFAVSLILATISVRRLVVSMLGVYVQTVVCVCGTAGLFKLNCTACICAFPLLQ